MDDRISTQQEKGEITREGKKPFAEPKLTYVTPTLREQGKVTELTANGFFGSFSP